MKRLTCNFIALLNQAIKHKKKTFRVAYFQHADTILRALIKEGYVQYYTRLNNTLTVHLRATPEGIVLSTVKQKSKPSNKSRVRWKQIKLGNSFQLILIGRKAVTGDAARSMQRGGIDILRFF